MNRPSDTELSILLQYGKSCQPHMERLVGAFPLGMGRFLKVLLIHQLDPVSN
jgi:hypothetical protein